MSLSLLTGIFFLNFFSRILFAPLLPLLETDLSLRHGQAGLFFFLLGSGYFLAQAASGMLASKIGHFQAIALSVAGIITALILVAIGPSLAAIRLATFLLGLAAGIYLPSAVATISHCIDASQWGRAFAIHELAPNLAFLLAPMYVALFPADHWRLAVAGPILPAAAVLLLHLAKGARTAPRPPVPDLHVLGPLLTSTRFWLMVFLFSQGITGTLGIYSLLPTYLVTVHGFTPASANLLVAQTRIPTLLAALAGGWLADRLGRSRCIALLLSVTACLTILLGSVPSCHVVLLAWLQPLTAVAFFPAAFALLSGLGPAQNRSLRVSLTIPLAYVLGGGLTPYLISCLADHHLFRQGIVAAGLAMLLGVLAARRITDTTRR